MLSWELFSVISGVAVTGADSSKIYSFLSAENRVGNSGFRATESNFRLRRAAMNSWTLIPQHYYKIFFLST